MNVKSRALLAAALLIAALGPVQVLAADQTVPGKQLSKQAVLSELTTRLDSKKSQPGEAVSARTLNPLKLNDGTVLPRGTVLLGKVTQVQPKSSGGASIGVIFDQVEVKGADPMAVRGLVVAVAAAPSLSDGGASTNDLPLGSGGDSKGAMASITGTGFSGEPAPLPPIKAGSSIKGIFLSPAPAADGSSVLMGSDKEIRLEKGTRLEIGLLAAK